MRGGSTDHERMLNHDRKLVLMQYILAMLVVSYFISFPIVYALTNIPLLRSRIKLTNKLKHCRIPLFQPYLAPYLGLL